MLSTHPTMTRPESTSIFHHDDDSAVRPALANEPKRLVHFAKRKTCNDRWPDDARRHQIQGVHGILPRAVTRADDLQLPLRNLDRVDRRKFRLLANDHDPPP